MADKAKGAIKDAAGKATGNKELQSEGKIDKGEGRSSQGTWGRERRVKHTTEK